MVITINIRCIVSSISTIEGQTQYIYWNNFIANGMHYEVPLSNISINNNQQLLITFKLCKLNWVLFRPIVSIIIIMELKFKRNSRSEYFDDALDNLLAKFGNLLSKQHVIQSALEKSNQIQF